MRTILITLAAALIATTTAQAATVIHKHQTRSALTNETAMAGKTGRAAMARMPSAAAPTDRDLSRYQNGAQSAPAGH